MSIKQELLLAIVIGGVLLLWASRVIYQYAYPVHHSVVECVVKDSDRIASRTRWKPSEDYRIKDFISWAEKRGETCAVVSEVRMRRCEFGYGC